MNLSTLKLVSAMSMAGVLAACGGGGGDPVPAAATPAPAPTAVANTGSVSAKFVPGTTPRYLLLGQSMQVSGAATPAVQDAAGVMTTLSGNTLSGSPTGTLEIAGDASYAQGRWVQGTVTTASGASTLTGTTASAAYHYVAHNALGTLPTSTSVPLVCAAARLTAPTYVSGGGAGAATATGSATGSATLSFGAAGAAVSAIVNATASGSSGSITGNATVTTPTSSSITGSYLSGGAGTQLTVADAGAGKYFVVAGYKVSLANGALHQGVATYLCQ